jgi:hypothetical protein
MGAGAPAAARRPSPSFSFHLQAVLDEAAYDISTLDDPGALDLNSQQQQQQCSRHRQTYDDSFAEGPPAGLADEFGDSSEWVSADFSFASPANGAQLGNWGLSSTFQPVVSQGTSNSIQQQQLSVEEWRHMQVGGMETLQAYNLLPENSAHLKRRQLG